METDMIDDNLTRYMALYQRVLNRVGDERVAIAFVHELAKDARMERIQAERLGGSKNSSSGEEWDSVPATARQLALLRVLNIRVVDGLTKLQASNLIDDAWSHREQARAA